MKYNCIVILGPTASGKTKLACALAAQINGEIISADSRQVYKHLDIGTGKDLEEYVVNGKSIPYHLINCCEPEEQFYLHQFVAELKTSFGQIRARQHVPIICGGTGLYLDALSKDFSFTQIKEDEDLRKELSVLPKEELIQRLQKFPEQLRAHVDLNSVKRLIRGIEVAEYRSKNPELTRAEALPYKPLYIGVQVSAEDRKAKITQRLKLRLEHGLIEEVQQLLKKGLTHQRLETLGLEYKFVSHYLQQKISREELFTQLQTAIFQFSKRQMTWFRKMEKEGINIHWVESDVKLEHLINLFMERR
ncbi:MAG: tRNA (adenosine(37)-N6)-dimethylallyltransferase MiaA [Bacteroidia bacterium]|nr:tRNA (adenosine(37)-N6)-dimethylallyltransferase MiaA [Bacteroidia bacterium]